MPLLGIYIFPEFCLPKNMIKCRAKHLSIIWQLNEIDQSGRIFWCSKVATKGVCESFRFLMRKKIATPNVIILQVQNTRFRCVHIIYQDSIQ